MYERCVRRSRNAGAAQPRLCARLRGGNALCARRELRGSAGATKHRERRRRVWVCVRVGSYGTTGIRLLEKQERSVRILCAVFAKRTLRRRVRGRHDASRIILARHDTRRRRTRVLFVPRSGARHGAVPSGLARASYAGRMLPARSWRGARQLKSSAKIHSTSRTVLRTHRLGAGRFAIMSTQLFVSWSHVLKRHGCAVVLCDGTIILSGRQPGGCVSQDRALFECTNFIALVSNDRHL